jgi:Uma2 family endonuclease
MSLPQTVESYTVDEYLALERRADERSEYLDGQVFLMAGESPEHGVICTNISGQLYAQLRGGPCQVFSKDMKVRSGPAPKPRSRTKGLYSYPDLLVVCGEPKFHDKHRDVLLNPVVIVEVLSPATEAFDRGEKWARYQTWLAELTDYLLVAQATPRVEHFQRATANGWHYAMFERLTDSVALASINCTLRLADVYDRVVMPPVEE